MRIALGIEYKGSGFCGWQSQASGCGVQDYVEAALTAFLGEPAAVVCAGRTDTGVHALAQVLHLDTGIMRDEVSWVRGTNAGLPAAVRIIWAKPVDDAFHARFSARSRTYRYLLLNTPVDNALLQGLAGWFHAPLDAKLMQQAADMLIGEHDFSSFRAAECQAKTPVKTLYEASVFRQREHLMFTFRGNAFLHHMVRNIVGSLVYVGAGRQAPEEFRDIFASRDRKRAAPTFAADGLYLSAIEYDDVFALPSFPARFPLID
ncbi:MAG TPA: tRNA pseudouridine(38-40) synthase TruA [Usitatibacteraceae bacterium]